MCVTSNRRPTKSITWAPAAFEYLRNKDVAARMGGFIPQVHPIVKPLVSGFVAHLDFSEGRAGGPSTDDTMMMIRSSTSEAAQKERSEAAHKRLPPGLTAKNHQRHYAQHNYHDHSQDFPLNKEEELIQRTLHIRNDNTAWAVTVDSEALSSAKQGPRGGVAVPFPLKLHELLDTIESDGFADVISWQPHGRAFAIHKTKKFVETLMPRYFRQSKITSFQRQLNLYGFSRVTRGKDKGGYYHELFLRGKLFLANRIMRSKVKGTHIKAVTSPETEPDFYSMPYVVDPSIPTKAASSHPAEMPNPAPSKVASSSFSPLSFAHSVPSPPAKVPSPSSAPSVTSSSSLSGDGPVPSAPTTAPRAKVTRLMASAALPATKKIIPAPVSSSTLDDDQACFEGMPFHLVVQPAPARIVSVGSAQGWIPSQPTRTVSSRATPPAIPSLPQPTRAVSGPTAAPSILSQPTLAVRCPAALPSVHPPHRRTVSYELSQSDVDSCSLDGFLIEIDKSFDFNLDAVDNDEDLGLLLDDIVA